MSRLRPRTIRSTHLGLGLAAVDWAGPEPQESLRSYCFRHGVSHLLSCQQVRAAEALLSDFAYGVARLESESGLGARPTELLLTLCTPALVANHVIVVACLRP